MDNRYSARSLSLRLGNRQIIHDVSLQLCGGGMTALIGPNGAGKSTLLRLLTGYLTPDGGVRVVEGRPLESWSAETLSRRRAVMLQRTQLHADWPVETVIAMGRSPWGGVANEEMIRRVMEETGCDHLAGRRYPSLSGGEQQRVQLARCLAQLWRDGAPEGWLFLDEPTSALDPELVGEVLDVIKKLARSGTTLVVVTHEIGFAREVADQVVFMVDGRIVEQGSSDEVLNHPQHPRTRQFLSRVLPS